MNPSKLNADYEIQNCLQIINDVLHLASQWTCMQRGTGDGINMYREEKVSIRNERRWYQYVPRDGITMYRQKMVSICTDRWYQYVPTGDGINMYRQEMVSTCTERRWYQHVPRGDGINMYREEMVSIRNERRWYHYVPRWHHYVPTGDGINIVTILMPRSLAIFGNHELHSREYYGDVFRVILKWL
jgi:hypothetical protein